MAWSIRVLYCQATPAARARLGDDPLLGPHLYHLRALTGRPLSQRAPQALPAAGLLALPGFGAPDDERTRARLPWDALIGDPKTHLGFPPRELLAERGVPAHAWPPRPCLAALKGLSHELRSPIIFYACDMWGGDLDLEAAWIPGWAPGEVDRVLFLDPKERVAYAAVGGSLTPLRRDVLIAALEYLRLQLPSPFFLPHTRAFEWERYRLRPREHGESDMDDSPWPSRHPDSLYARVAAGDREGAARLLAAGVDPNAYWTTPLELAASQGRPDLVALLLAHGAEGAPKGRLSALHAAADVESARLLIAAAAPLDGGDAPTAATGEVTPERVARLLIELGAEPAAARAAINGRPDVITPLASAARAGHDEVARLLVELGADLRPPGTERLLWLSACEGGLLWLVERLLEAGYDAELRRYEESGERGLEAAAKAGHRAVVERLLAAGCALDAASLHAACEGGIVELVFRHLAAGLAPGAGHFGMTPLATAIRGGHLEVVRLLLDAGADPHKRHHHETLLHLAAEAGEPAVVELLLDRGLASVLEERDALGWTPLFAAGWRGHQAVFDLLIARGAALDVVDDAGRQLVAEAAAHGIRVREG
ncbi:MAG: ankyrin repeat domain-containing protein [Myxococcales bacterium]|nr:ankyrin repeat domain-containing protein [Myxococcales bacterium]